MSELKQVGYSLVDISNGQEITGWGNKYEECIMLPDVIKLPNQDWVFCGFTGYTNGNYKLVERWMELNTGKNDIFFDGEKIIVKKEGSD